MSIVIIMCIVSIVVAAELQQKTYQVGDSALSSLQFFILVYSGTSRCAKFMGEIIEKLSFLALSFSLLLTACANTVDLGT